MLFQSVAPAAFLVTPAYAATDAAVVTVSDVTLDFSEETNEFTLKGVASESTEFVLTYNDENDETPEEAILGTVEVSEGTFTKTVYAGTCSGEDCIAHEVTSGALQFNTADYSAEFSIVDDTLWLRSGKVATVATVEAGKTYVAPQNEDVTVTFTKLPENPGSLSIEEITLSDEQVLQLGALSNVAYDITSSMENGTFEYELTLPRPEGITEEVGMVYAESVGELAQAQPVDSDFVEEDAVIATGLDHFTVFVVTFEDPQDPTPTTAGYNDYWFDYAGGTISQVPSGTNGIISAEGDNHAEITGPVFTRWGGFKNDFPVLGYETTLDVYLDMTLADGSDKRFDFSSAINNPSGGHRRDFIIHLGTNPSVVGQWLASASNNAPGWPGNPDRNPATISESGWYTIEHSFKNVGGILEVTISLYKKGDATPVGSWVLSDPSDTIGGTVGGNRYGWFTSQRFDFDWLAIDNAAISSDDPTVTTVIIPKDNVSWLFNRDITTASPYNFTTDQASIGTGSLYAHPIANTYPVATKEGNDKFIAEDFVMSPIADINKITYDYMIGSGGDTSDANHFYMSVYANFGESPENKYYDCRYSVVPSVGSTSGFTTVTFDPSQAYPVATRTGSEASPYTCPTVPADMDTLSPGSIIRVYALNMGDTSMNDTGLDGYFDNVVVDKGAEITVYDFEPMSITAPTNLGWNLRSKSASANERPVDVICGGTTNADYQTYSNGMIAHNWETTESIPNLKYQRQWMWPGSGTWNTDGTVYSATNTNYATFGSSVGTEGTWNTRVRAWVDQNGNNTFDEGIDAVSDWSNECAVTYDRTAPSVPVNPSHNNVSIPTNNFDFDWDDSTDASLPITYEFQSSLNPAETDGVLTTGLWKSGTLPTSMIHSSGAPDGTWYWQVRAIDAAGNVSDWSEIWNVTLDKVAPTTPQILGFLSPDLACSSLSNTHSITVDWTDSTDAGSGFDHYEYFIDYPLVGGGRGQWTTNRTVSQYGGSLNEGLHSVKVRAVDALGHTSSWSNTCDITTDWTAPTTTLSSPEADSTTNGEITIAGTSTDTNGVNFVSLYYQLDGESDWTLIDTVDNGSDNSPFAFSYGWTPATSGVYNIKAAGTDVAGNVEASAYVYGVTYDVAIPALSILSPSADSAFNGEFTVHGTASDALSGIDKVRVRFRNESNNALVATFWATYNSSDDTWTIDINDGVNTLADGYYLVRVVAFDNSGNTRSRTVRRIYVDSVEPSSEITSPDNDFSGDEIETNSFDGLIAGTASDDNSGVAEVNLEIMYTPFGSTDSVYWNGTDWQTDSILVTATGTDTWSYQIDPDFVEDGIYDVTSHATDNAGNVESTYTIKIIYDKTIPEVTLTIDPSSPDGDNGWYRFTEPTITLDDTDNYEVGHIEYQWNTTNDGDWIEYTGPFNPPSEGQNVLYYRGIDKVGNVMTDLGVKDVKYDKTNPAGQPLNVKVENITADDADGLWEAPTDDSDVSKYVLEWKHEDGTTRGATVSRTTFKHKLDQLKDGLWTFSVKAMDAAGNFTEQKADFRVGPGPSTSSGETTTPAVLGVSTESISGTGVGGLFNTQSTAQDEENTEETEQADAQEGAAAGTDSEGDVLGESTCAPWLYYLPLFMLLLQVLVILGFEFFRRSPGLIKLVVAAGTTLAVIVVFNFLRDMSCYVDGSWLASIAQWFPGISIAFGVITKMIAYGFIEEA